MLNPSVFRSLGDLTVWGFVNSISGNDINQIKSLRSIELENIYFKSLIHKNGINWIKEINSDLNVNLRMGNQKMLYLNHTFEIIILSQSFLTFELFKIKYLFPVEDFCLYRDFPFNQLIILTTPNTNLNLVNTNKLNKYCTYLFIVQYYDIYIQFFYQLNRSDYLIYNMADILNYMNDTINSQVFHTISECNFKERLKLCNKSYYQGEKIWGTSDYYILNKKLQIVLKITTYLVSFIGIVSNLLVVLVILNKNNSDLFKEFRYKLFVDLTVKVEIKRQNLCCLIQLCLDMTSLVCLD